MSIAGGTGYIGRALIERLIAAGHNVTALARPTSRSKVPAGARVVEGSALKAADVAASLTDGCTLVLLVGTPHPNPSKAREFNDVDLESVKAAASAIEGSSVGHVIYVSVAHPAPVMKAYIAVRSEGERLLGETGVPLTVLRPWYVLGPGHWWPLALVPLYKLLERIPSKRDTALRLGLVTHAQMVGALAAAVAAGPGSATRIVDVPGIRASESRIQNGSAVVEQAMPDQRRSLLRLGAMLLLIAAAMGLAAAIPLPNPARWMTAHVTAIMLGTLIMVQGLVWRDLRLSDGQRRWLVRLVYISVWSGVALGVAAAVLDIPGPATSPGVSPAGVQVPILATLLAIIIPTTIASWVLLFIGLRGQE